MSVVARLPDAVGWDAVATCNGCSTTPIFAVVEFDSGGNTTSVVRLCANCTVLLTAHLLVLLPPITTEGNTP